MSIGSAGSQGDQNSLFPSISADGRFVAFISGSSNFVRRDINQVYDVFIRGPLH